MTHPTVIIIRLLGSLNLAIRSEENEVVREMLYKEAKRSINESDIIDKTGFLERLDESYLPSATGEYQVVAVAGTSNHIHRFLSDNPHDFIVKEPNY